MDLYYSKNRDLYVPNCYPFEISKDGKKVKGFIRGEGWKNFVVKKVEGVELSDDTWDMDWMYVAKLYTLYGIEVANVYASKMTAGIVSRQTAIGYGKVYEKLKELDIDSWMDKDFFKLLKCNYLMSCFGGFMFDIIRFDENLSVLDSDYDCNKCTYKGKNISTSDYVKLKFGEQYVKVIDLLIEKI